jgi:O-antigen/teichoic acid export membrane protein
MTPSDPVAQAGLTYHDGEIPVLGTVERPGSRVRFIGARFFQYGILFVNAVLVTRALGPAGRARYALPITLAAAVWTVTNLSMDLAAGRMVARQEAPLTAITQVLATVTIVTSTVGVAIAIGLGAIGHGALIGGASISLVFLSALTIPALMVQMVSSFVLLVLGDLRRYGTISIVAALAQLSGTAVLVAVNAMTPLRAIALILGGFSASGGLMLWAVVRNLGRGAIRPRVSRPIARSLLRTGVATHPLTLAIQLGPLVDLLIVGALVSARQTGLYSLACTLADSAMLGSLALAQTSLHPLTVREQGDAVAFNVEFSRENFHLAVLAAIAVAIGAYPFVVGVYGWAWAGAAIPFIIITIGLVSSALENPARLLLLRIGTPAALSAIAAAGVALNAALTVSLTVPLGIIGASIGTLGALWLYTGAVLTILRRHNAGVPLRELVRWPKRDDLVREVPRDIGRRMRALRSSTRLSH